jgi:predicted ArsR family transcriptional regulator
MTKTILNKSRARVDRKKKRTGTCVAGPATAERPGGKLGLILKRLSTKKGATADELVDATGWQRHSVRGALSRLRARGFVIYRDVVAGREAYRLDAVEQ